MKVFEAFLAKIDNPSHKERTAEVLAWVNEKFPTLVPVIKWNQPMFTDHGTYIIGFSVAKHHIAVAPEMAGINQFANKIIKSGYDHTANLIKIPWKDPVDFPLLEKIIEFNIEDKADCTNFWR